MDPTLLSIIFLKKKEGFVTSVFGIVKNSIFIEQKVCQSWYSRIFSNLVLFFAKNNRSSEKIRDGCSATAKLCLPWKYKHIDYYITNDACSKKTCFSFFLSEPYVSNHMIQWRVYRVGVHTWYTSITIWSILMKNVIIFFSTVHSWLWKLMADILIILFFLNQEIIFEAAKSFNGDGRWDKKQISDLCEPTHIGFFEKIATEMISEVILSL